MKNKIKKFLVKIKDIKRINKKAIIIDAVTIFAIVLAICRFYQKTEIKKLVNEMYFIEVAKCDECYMLINVETNMFYKFDEKDKNVKPARVYFKDGAICDIMIDVENKIFKVKNVRSNILNNKVFRYNKNVDGKIDKSKVKKES